MNENKKSVKSVNKNSKGRSTLDPVVIGMFIAQNRDRHNLTQEQLADKIFVSRKTVSKWETGNGIPSADLWKPICEELNISLDELLDGEFIDRVSETKCGISRRILRNSTFRLFVIIFSLIMSFLILCFLVVHLNSNVIYVINYEDDNFSITKGLITFSYNECLINFGEFSSDLKDNHNFSYELYYTDKENTYEHKIVSFTGTNKVFNSSEICRSIKDTIESNGKKKLHLRVSYMDEYGNDTYFKLNLSNSLSRKFSLDRSVPEAKIESYNRDPNFEKPISDASPANSVDDDIPLDSINVKFLFDLTSKELNDCFDGKKITVDDIDYNLIYEDESLTINANNNFYRIDFDYFKLVYNNGDKILSSTIKEDYAISFTSNRINYFETVYKIVEKLKGLI